MRARGRGPRRAGAIVLFALAALWTAGLASGYDVSTDADYTRSSIGPSVEHWLGTDHLGRDVFWRMAVACQAFFGPGLAACAVALGLGVPGGAAAGWMRPLTPWIRYTFTVIDSIPRFVLVLLVCSIYGSSIWVIGVAAGAAYAPSVGEAIYNRVEAFRRAEFVLAAEAHGVHPARVLVYHVLWVNARGLIIRHALQLFAFVLLLETTLSYMGARARSGGFGVQEPSPSWGNMLAFEWGVRDGNLWATLGPALAIWIAIGGALLLAEGLEASDA